MPAAWVGPGCREKRVNFRRDRWLHGPDSESPTGKAGRHSRSTVAGLGEKRRLFFLYSLTFNMVALESSNLSDSDVVSVLKALIKAEKFIADQPDEAMKLVAQFLDKELQQVKRLWPNYDYRMHLKDSLRLTIDSQIKWRDKLEKVDSEILGNLETFFRVKPLSLVDDGRVSLTF